MRFFIVPVVIALVVNAIIDFYIYCALHSYCKRKFWPRVQAVLSVVCAIALISAIFLPKRGGSDGSLHAVMWILYAYCSIYLPKIIFVLFDVLSRIPFIWRAHRWKWMSWAGFGVGIAVFIGMWWGALFGRYHIQVKEVPIEVRNLPQGIGGLTIAQISDLHVGTFGSDTAFVSKLVDRINSLQPDLVVFTGDIVNRKSDELKPFVSTLSRLQAPLGVYSIMGNHDYGDYFDWPTLLAKDADVKALQRMQGQMGWRMLNNQSAWIKYRGDSILLIGVENIGDPPFKRYGDLRKACRELSDSTVKVLLSHNPAHWDMEVSGKTNIALTLSGHTHAMQMQLFGWSPATWRYPRWGGLYSNDQGQLLYVNIGAGEVGFPARIGAYPEITLFTLKPASK